MQPVLKFNLLSVKEPTMSQTKPQLYKFQIIGYEESHPDVFILGLGTIDEQNRFTGTLKHQDYGRDLSKPAECNAKSDPYCAWTYAYGNYYYGYYYAVLVTALPITNITLVQQQEQGADPGHWPLKNYPSTLLLLN
jgi:hypothetical protein